MPLELELPRLLAPDLPSSCYSLLGLDIASIAQTLTPIGSQGCYFSSLPPQCSGIGQFARLLPALAVGAVSQAPSPESNPDSLLPVKAMVSHYLTINS